MSNSVSTLFTSQQREQICQRLEAVWKRCPQRRAAAEEYLASLPEGDARDAMRFCIGFMPVSDLVSYDFALIGSFVRHALMLREKVEFVSRIPADLFLNYVLYYRINNENIEEHRDEFYKELAPRIQGMTMAEAALEVNYWCFEKATYANTDNRTASPLTVLRNAAGRCGEESTLTVSALRSVGIPARQCYTPRWAHCDDNHAWVEVWTDGEWHYLGACEPEPVMDRGWFTAAASKAMLVHSKVFSDLTGDELVAARTPVFSTINSIATYGKCREVTARVVEGGKPVSGAKVQFELVNYGELFPIAASVTDENGKASLTCGMGDLYIHVTDGKRWQGAKVDVRRQDCVELDLSLPSEEEPFSTFDMIPPEENLPASAQLTDQQVESHKRRNGAAADIRQAFEDTFYHGDKALEACAKYAPYTEQFAGYLTHAKGNHAEILAFFNLAGYGLKEKNQLLSTLRNKDFSDTSCALLKETLDAALPFQDKPDEKTWTECVLAPRADNEMLVSCRPFIKEFFAGRGVAFSSAPEVWNWIHENTDLQDEYEYGTLTASAPGILSSGVSTKVSNRILFVNICRTFGIPARLSPVSGKMEYWTSNGFSALSESEEAASESAPALPTATLTLHNGSGKALDYFTNVSIAKLEDGVYHSLQYWGEKVEETRSFPVYPGHYRVLTANRQIDGSLLVNRYCTDVSDGGESVVEITLRADQITKKLKNVGVDHTLLTKLDGQQIYLKQACSHSYAILAFTEPGREPTEHLFNEILELKERYSKENLDLIITVSNAEELENRTLKKLMAEVPCQVYLHNDLAFQAQLHREMGVGDERKPFVMAVSNLLSGMEGLYAFANYNVGTAATLLNIIDADKGGAANV